MNYEPIPTSPDLCELTLEDAAIRCGVPLCYELRIGKYLRVLAVRVAKSQNALTKENPLAPYINIVEDPEFGNNEWCLTANGKSVGSKGF